MSSDTNYEAWMDSWVHHDEYTTPSGIVTGLFVAYAPDSIEPVYIASNPEHVYNFLKGYTPYE